MVELRQAIDTISPHLRWIDRFTRRWWFGEIFAFVVCFVIIAVALVLTPSVEVVSLFGHEIPVMCGFRRVTGIGCPGCGMTRAFSLMAHGEFFAAWNVNMLGPPTFLLVAFQVPYRAFKLIRGYQRRRAR